LYSILLLNGHFTDFLNVKRFVETSCLGKENDFINR
jgi:hypothetical protein